MIQFVEKYFKPVLIGAGVLILGICAYSFLQEHDARILAEQSIKASNDRIATLEKDKAAIVQAGQQKIIVLQKQEAAVKTPAQAIAAIPDVSTLPLNVRSVPSMPDSVAVDAVPLFKELNECKQTAVGLTTCQAAAAVEQKTEDELRGQIKALKAKPSFWKRAKQTAEVLAIGAAVGYAAHR